VTRRLGAYGLRLLGVDSAAPMLVEAPGEWLDWTIERRVGPTSATPMFDERRACLPLQPAGALTVDRDEGRALYETPEQIPDAALVHPYLAPAAAIAATWRGLPSLHGGAFLAAGGAWAVLGEPGSGKSSLLAQLHAHGCQVLSDDLVVVDRGRALAGPRCIDLRRDVSDALAAGRPIGMAGMRERWRVDLGPVPADVPLRGVIELRWADSAGVERLAPSARLATLDRHAAVITRSRDVGALLSMADLPMLAIARRGELSELAGSASLVLEALDHAGS
jgi:hypothetical protein